MDLPECKICNIIYHHDADRKPRILQCGHTCCSKCLREMLKDRTIECPFCKKETTLATDSLNTDDWINYDILDYGAKFCFISGCQNKVDESGLYCPHCQYRVCMECAPNHFGEYKQIVLTGAKRVSEKYSRLLLNLENIKSYANSDLEWSKIYREKNVAKIKDAVKKLEVEKEVERFCAHMNQICQKIDTEAKKLDENGQTVEELIFLIETMKFDQEAGENNCLIRLHAISKKVNELENYEPDQIDSKINIKTDKGLYKFICVCVFFLR